MVLSFYIPLSWGYNHRETAPIGLINLQSSPSGNCAAQYGNIIGLRSVCTIYSLKFHSFPLSHSFLNIRNIYTNKSLLLGQFGLGFAHHHQHHLQVTQVVNRDELSRRQFQLITCVLLWLSRSRPTVTGGDLPGGNVCYIVHTYTCKMHLE